MNKKNSAREASAVVAVAAPEVVALHEGRQVTIIDFTRGRVIGATYQNGRLAVGAGEQSYTRVGLC